MLSLLVSLLAAATLAPHSSTVLTIHRSYNRNLVNYDVRLDGEGLIEEAAPVDVYWLLHEEDGRREELGFFERRVYGDATTVAADRRSLELVIRGLPARAIHVRIVDARPIVETEIASEPAVLEDVFIECGKMSIDSVRLRGRTLAGKPVEETLRR